MKNDNILLTRAPLIFCLVLLSSHLVFANHLPEKPVTITTLLVHSWLPELGKPGVETGSIEEGLFAVADLVLRGDFKSAEQMLNDLAQKAPSNRTKVLVLLWRRQLEQRRYLFLGGGAQIFGAPMIDAMKRELIEKKRIQELDILISQLPPDEIRDSRIADQYCRFLFSLNNLPAQIRSRKLSAELKETTSDDAALNSTEQMILKAIEDNGRVAVQLGLLGETENQLSLRILVGQLAAARRDFDTARLQFKAGLEQASQVGLRQCAAEFMLRLGDLEAIPYGDALTFGYNSLSESQVRLMLKSDITPSVRRIPSADALATAEAWYNKADTAFNDLPQSASRHLFKFRRAHLARMRGDSTTAIQLYQEAANLAREEKAWTAAAVADASAALLLGSRTLFLNSMKSLKDRGDMGAVLSVAQVAHSWATRNWYVLHNYPQAITTFRMLGDALVDSNLDREAVDPLFDLAWLESATWRAEMSIATIQEAANAQRSYLAEAERTEKQYQLEISSMPDKVGLSHERDLLGFLLTQLLGELNIKVITEEAKEWVQQRERVSNELTVLGSVSSSITSDSRTQMLNEQNQVNKIQYEVGAALQNKKCEDALLVYNQARSRASKLNQPFLLSQLDAMASRCDSKLVNQARSEMEALNPVAEIRKARANGGSVPSLAAQLNIRRAVGNFMLLADLAASTQLYDLLAGWIDQLDQTIRNDSMLQGLGPTSQGFRAVSLLGQNHADQARVILNRLAFDEQLWSVVDPEFKIATLGLLVETESVLGNAESALFALERLRFELEQQQEIRSGVRPALRMSAEQAMLEREVANAGTISPQQAGDLRRLRSETAQFADRSVQAPRLSDTKAALAAIPPKTTVLVYHIGPQAITLWQGTPDQPLKMVRLSAPLKDTIQLITKLQKELVERFAWQSESSELYQRLIAKTDPIRSGDTIAVVATGVLSRLPFEILGPNENSLLMKNHPIVYLDRLSGADVKKNPPPTAGQGVLIAGLNSQGLKEAEGEARGIGDLLHSDPLLGPAVTNKNILDKLKSASWVHLATHANVESTNPYASYLLLADGQRMEAWELFRYAPQAEMIVLSACDTKAAIQPLTGPVTLTADANSLASFALAGGARWVMASLWRADDLGSATLMRDFYSHLVNEHLDPPHALQKAKQEAANRAGAQPFYYAQFLLSARNLSALQPTH
jgi:CHAT domain-containing protein